MDSLNLENTNRLAEMIATECKLGLRPKEQMLQNVRKACDLESFAILQNEVNKRTKTANFPTKNAKQAQFNKFNLYEITEISNRMAGLVLGIAENYLLELSCKPNIHKTYECSPEKPLEIVQEVVEIPRILEKLAHHEGTILLWVVGEPVGTLYGWEFTTPAQVRAMSENDLGLLLLLRGIDSGKWERGVIEISF